MANSTNWNRHFQSTCVAWMKVIAWVYVLGMLGANVSIGVSEGGDPIFKGSDEEPSWKKGISTWGRGGYQLPKVVSDTVVADSSSNADIATPYTVPVDPTSQVPRSDFLRLPILDDDPLQLSLPSPKTDDFQLPSPASSGLNTHSAETVQADRQRPVADLPLSNSALANDSIEQMTSASIAVEDREPLLDNDSRAGLPLADPQPGANSDEENPATLVDLADQVNASDSLEPAPLQTEVIRWYQYPRRWMKGWDSHAEFGLDGSDGNANTLAIQTGLELKRKAESYTLGIDVNYRQASSRNKTTEENGRFNVDYDRLLGDTFWSAFGKFGMEWDRFKPFDLRLNMNSGFGYYWVRSDDTTLVTRFGAGASREIGAPIDNWTPEAVFGFEAERQLTSRQKLKGKFDYFPSWENFGDYRLVSDVAWEILLDGSENLSLKLAATDRYDSTPQGARPNDVYYSLLLLYKF